MKPKLYREDCHHAERYYHSQGEAVETPSRSGFTVFPVLEFLWGQIWDDVALSCVLTLRPSMIRVTSSYLTSDAWQERVTVYVADDLRTITRIDQEVRVYLFGEEKNSHEFGMTLRGRGIDLNRHLSEDGEE